MKFKGQEVTFLGWLDNVWYHFKAPIIIGFLATVILVVCSVQFFSREEHDVFIYVAGERGLAAKDADAFMTEMQDTFAIDSNDDGKTVVDMKIDKFVMVENASGNKKIFNPTEQMNPIQRFNLELADGECIIYIIQPDFFKGNLKYFASFEDTLGYVPDKAISGKGIRLSDLDAYTASMTLGYFPEDYIICIADKDKKYDDEYYNGNVEFLKNLIEWNVKQKQ
ncbi:MAG: hypothetical protein E7600_07320 [Ruminococcaceae bacterium]|nr:hypothetical protein [Oscillospiraceae bacterium]